jgi:hypothetical protein
MSTDSPQKLNVLLVDDDEHWLADITTQSRRLRESKLNIDSKNSYASGLDYLDHNPDVDLVVVEFIKMARQKGVICPYVVVSNARLADAPANSDRSQELLLSNPVDFIEKRNTVPFYSFQNHLVRLHQEFYDMIAIASKRALEWQKSDALRRHSIHCDVYDLGQLLKTYSPKVRSMAFDAACAHLEANSLDLITRRSFETDKTHPNRDNEILPVSERVAQPNSVVADTSLRQIVGRIPYYKNQTKVINYLNHLSRKLIDGDQAESKSKIPSDEQIVDWLFEKEKISPRRFLENVVFFLADLLNKKKESIRGVNLLYTMSKRFFDYRLFNRAAQSDLLIGIYILRLGDPDAAAVYLRSAHKLAERTEDHSIRSLIEDVTALAISGATEVG